MAATCYIWLLSEQNKAEHESCEFSFSWMDLPEDYNPGEKLSDSSKELLCRGWWGETRVEGQYIYDFVKEVHVISAYISAEGCYGLQEGCH